WFLAIIAPAAFLLAIEVVRGFLLEPLVPPHAVRAAVLAVGLGGGGGFTPVMFGLLGGAQRRVGEPNPQPAALDEASIVIASELSLDRVLQRIVDIARELSSARYAALGVVGPDGYLTALITSGLSPEERARIGEFPKSHGILGKMLREGHAV